MLLLPTLALTFSPRAPPPRCCAAPKVGSLLETADNYDALLLDQFGVIHDGKTAYEGSVAAVRELQKMGKKIVIISNSSRRRGDTVARLLSMGFGPVQGESREFLNLSGGRDAELVPISVVTSGDLVFEGLLAGTAPPFDDLGIRAFVFGNGDDDEVLLRSRRKTQRVQLPQKPRGGTPNAPTTMADAANGAAA